MYKSFFTFRSATLSSYNVMAKCENIGEAGGGGQICCTVVSGTLECSDSLG